MWAFFILRDYQPQIPTVIVVGGVASGDAYGFFSHGLLLVECFVHPLDISPDLSCLFALILDALVSLPYLVCKVQEECRKEYGEEDGE